MKKTNKQSAKKTRAAFATVCELYCRANLYIDGVRCYYPRLEGGVIEVELAGRWVPLFRSGHTVTTGHGAAVSRIELESAE